MVRAAAFLKELVESKARGRRCREFGALMDAAAALEKACLLLESLGRA
jgi:hypothetical protein